jgi:superfamily II DNA or RNA helicase
MTLDGLAERAEDESTRELLCAIFEAGEADTLRNLLSEGSLERIVDTHCTAREEERLRAQLARWCTPEPSLLDDPERLVHVPEPPRDEPGLMRWARAHGVARELEAGLVAAHTAEQAAPESLLDVLDAQTELRGELWAQALARAVLPTRRALWEAAPPQRLALLARRLRAVLDGTDLASLSPMRFARARPVRIDASTTCAQAAVFGASSSEPCAPKLLLSGFEQRALSASCSCEAAACLHVKALAARLYEACVAPDDRLHAELLALVEVPTWRRFLDAARGDEPRATSAAQTVAFQLQVGEDGGLSLTAHALRGSGNGTRRAPAATARSLLRGASAESEDRPVLDAMLAAGRAQALRVPATLALLRALADHPRLYLDGESAGLTLVEERLAITLDELPEGLVPHVQLQGSSRGIIRPPGETRFSYSLDRATGRLVFAELTPALARLMHALDSFRGVLPKESFPQLSTLLSGLKHTAQVAVPTALLGHERPAPRTLTLHLARAPGEGLCVSLTTTPLPLGAPWPPGRGPELVYGLVDGVQTHTRRDLPFERAQATRLIDTLGLTDGMRTGECAYALSDEQAALSFLMRAAQLHTELALVWAEPARALCVGPSLNNSHFQVRLFKKGDWFGLEGQKSALGTDLPLAKLLDAVRRGERFVKIEGNTYAEIAEELRERLLRIEPLTHAVQQAVQLPQNAVPRVLEGLGEECVELDDSARALVHAAARRETSMDVALPSTLTLRPYQEAGLRFMLQRSAWASGVCLADDMGLGKTVQCIALLWMRRARGAQLVVAPTSMVSTWQSELSRFAPALEVRWYMGEGRASALRSLGPDCVLVTSYDVLLRDRDKLAGSSFATHIIDEAQWVKNARTERFSAVDAICAEFRVALSGTPIENRLGDLFSLFSLVAPGLLGSWPRFRARFAVPIERYEDRERTAALRALIAPFLLRREKSQVATELPERTEVVHRIELSAPERDLYGAALRDAKRRLDLRGRDPRVPRLQVLAEITRLRQLACHPRLVLAAPQASSSKLRALLTLLRDLLPRGHRVLLFSQFTRHLELVREALVGMGVAHLVLTGETSVQERKARVAAFQRGEVPVFLISLKAGGAGLTLTAADYVIHLDPWWNPAAEDQASDRAHRIGQTRPVTVVKLVSEGTIEERVLSLHTHKRRLFAGLFEGDGSATGSEVQAASLAELLADDPSHPPGDTHAQET